MTPSTTALDAVDRAFVWRADRARRQPPESMEPEALRVASWRTDSPRPDLVVEPDADTLVDRLLRAVPQAWANLAERVEDAHRNGAEVIAVTGARRGEGRTTVVECLARTLVTRGRRVECHNSVPLERSLSAVGLGDSSDSLVLIDAGVWFSGGPVRRAWLARQSIGCQAVILVRRADQPECAARGVALESVGLKVLGEVLTMVPPSISAIRVSEGL